MNENIMTRVFVYGTLKRGMGNHRVMQEAKGRLLGSGSVYGYACINTPWFPYAYKKEGARIIGEIYAIPKENIADLDVLEGYPHFYNRAVTDTSFGPAWIYFLDHPDQHHITTYGLVEEWTDK